MALVAHDADDRVDQLIRLTDRLTELVSLSAKAFEGRRPQDAAAYIEETGRLANIYRHEAALVRGDPALVAMAAQARRTQLVQSTEAFDAVLARQGRALEAAKVVTEGLVRAIAEEVAIQRNQAANYGPDATTSTPGAATAITLNRRA
jgi:hypothetical protein